jgi:hypothetical protein
MFTRNRVHTSRERSDHRNKAVAHSVLAVFFFKGTSSTTMTAGDGVSTYLALIFGTLLSSQGTDASFVLTLSGFPPGFSLRSCVSDSTRPFPVPISSVLSRFPLPRFPFRRFRLYQILSGLTPSQRGLPSRPLGRSDVSNLSRFPRRSSNRVLVT